MGVMIGITAAVNFFAQFCAFWDILYLFFIYGGHAPSLELTLGNVSYSAPLSCRSRSMAIMVCLEVFSLCCSSSLSFSAVAINPLTSTSSACAFASASACSECFLFMETRRVMVFRLAWASISVLSMFLCILSQRDVSSSLSLTTPRTYTHTFALSIYISTDMHTNSLNKM